MRSFLYRLFARLGCYRVFAYANRRRPIVLAFHGVTADESDDRCNYQGKHLRASIFERIMTLVAERYRAVPLAAIVEWLNGHGALPKRAVAITFDDGYRNNATEAAPILSRLGIPATVFVVTDFVTEGRMLWTDVLVSAIFATRETTLRFEWQGQPYSVPLGTAGERRRADATVRALCKTLDDGARDRVMALVVSALRVSDDDIRGAWSDHAPLDAEGTRALQDAGIDIGSHTRHHSIVSRLDAETMRDEVARSREIVAQLTGRPCSDFAYPNGGPGDFNAATGETVRAAGYRCAVTTIKRRVRRDDDPYSIPRCIVTHNQMTIEEFDAELSGFAGFVRGIKSLGRRA